MNLNLNLRTTHSITTKHGTFIALVIVITWLDLGEFSLNSYFGKFSLEISDVFFQGQILFWPYLRDGWFDWYEMNRKYIGWILGIICDLIYDRTQKLDLGCFKVIFQNNRISGIVGVIDVKWIGSKLIEYWTDCMTLPFDHTQDLELGTSRSESEIALSQEWGIPLTWNEKDVSHPLMTIILTSVTIVGWADEPNSDQGDFRCRSIVIVFYSGCVSDLLNVCLY